MAKYDLTPWGQKANIAKIEKQLSMEDIAKSTGYTKQYISAIMHGRVKSDVAIKKVSVYLGIPDTDEDPIC